MDGKTGRVINEHFFYFLFICKLHLYANAVCVCLHMTVEARGGYWVPYSFKAKSLPEPGACQVRLEARKVMGTQGTEMRMRLQGTEMRMRLQSTKSKTYSQSACSFLFFFKVPTLPFNINFAIFCHTLF